ncbi:MAG TPA: hypothetical protein VFU75_09570, partial [Gemmatimonadales bacterium]|nr:hypothetical protein [Gemmatimonadales bacterium]
MTSPAQAYSRPIRAIAVVVAIALALRQYLSLSVSPPAYGRLLAVRIGTLVLAIGIAWLATPGRSVRTLRVYAMVLGLSLALAGCLSGLILPTRFWEVAGLLPAVVLGVSLFIPWPWPWQATFATSAFLIECLTLRWIPDAALPTPLADEGALVLLFSAGIASTIGSRIADNERRRVAESEARFRALFEGAGDPIAALEPDGRVHDA